MLRAWVDRVADLSNVTEIHNCAGAFSLDAFNEPVHNCHHMVVELSAPHMQARSPCSLRIPLHCGV